ncbi:hypothetical protein BV25DRAFT_1922767 [Artomyces pyxidatus]|uniref:Uncharacterized protein n=1 Tax=Artomyces pyxidatus TaxID=48021 RepID=A0ACB8SDN7_9AGAM|nr:hypothetical protein BV25DRAFT_1922767 [Artomyces pyxidatus]
MEDSKERTAESEETGAWLTMPDGRVRWVPFPNQTTDGKPLYSDAEIAKMAKESEHHLFVLLAATMLMDSKVKDIILTVLKAQKDLEKHEVAHRSLTETINTVLNMTRGERAVAEGAIVSVVSQLVAAAELRQAGSFDVLFGEVKRHVAFLQADARQMHETLGDFDMVEHNYTKIAKRMEEVEQFITAYRVDEQSRVLKDLAASLSNVLEEGDGLLRRRLDFNVTRRFLIVMLFFTFVLQCVAIYLLTVFFGMK